MADTWSMVETAFDPKTNRAYEGLFALGSGYLHVRGSLEEHLADAPQNTEYMRLPANVTAEKFPETKARWGTYVPGIFGVHPLLNAEMINLPWFLALAPVVEAEKLDVEHCDIRDYRRSLDMRTATLRRSMKWRTRGGPEIAVTFERFVSAARKHLCVQRITLGVDKDVTIEVRGGIDADVRTNGYDHFAAVELTRPADSDLECRVRTDAGDGVTLRSRIGAPRAEWAHHAGDREAELTGTFRIAAGGPLVIEKRTAVCTSRDLAPTDPAAVLDDAAGMTYEQLHAEHAAVWQERWDRADVVIEGDDRSQLAMRCSLYHLLRAHVPDDARVAIDAKGCAGEGYFGRYFWDTEMNLLPFYLYTHPDKARTLVDFRVGTLDGARRNAAACGYRGARYAWESDNRGIESCACWQYRDHEVHVTADVAYAMAHYARAADDAEYLHGPAAEVFVETARYWMDRIDRRPGDDHPSLLGVMGPDEYCPISHNNSYTNRMVAFALRTASEIGPAGGAGEDECNAFAETAAGLPILRDARRKLILQCEDFELLADPAFDRLWTDRSRGFAAQVSQERIYRSRCLKQADVLMLMMLFPREFTDEEVAAAWDYYLPLTTHDSSLSAGVHAIVACRLGRTGEAWDFWEQSCGIDLDGGAAEGVHIAAAGNNWQIAVLGFAGLSSAMHTDVLTLDPRIPPAWSRLAFPIVWRRCPVQVDITAGRTAVTNRGDCDLKVSVAGQARTVRPGTTETFET